MDVQFYGANCLLFSNKDVRLVVDDNLSQIGAKSIAREGDIAVFTTTYEKIDAALRMIIDMPGEYEVGNVSVQGIAARAHMDEEKTFNATMYKITAGEIIYLVTGHVYPELSDEQLERIGMVDVMFVPVGGNGYTLDPLGAQKLIRKVEPKLVIPTHYEDAKLNYPVPQQPLEGALKEMAFEPKERIEKLRIKPGELSDITQVFILEKTN